jgi:hypothetical protein
MYLSLDITLIEDLDGTVMDYQLNMKLINNLELNSKKIMRKWELNNIMLIAETL